MPSERIFLALGSNVGERLENIVAALRKLQDQVVIQKLSSVYTSPPMYVLEQSEFYNMVLEAITELSPEELLRFCKDIEQFVGRIKRQRNGPREIDIDILFYGDQVIAQSDLQIPHASMAERPFVLVPLVEIAPEYAPLLQELGEFEQLIQSVSPQELRKAVDSGASIKSHIKNWSI